MGLLEVMIVQLSWRYQFERNIHFIKRWGRPFRGLGSGVIPMQAFDAVHGGQICRPLAPLLGNGLPPDEGGVGLR